MHRAARLLSYALHPLLMPVLTLWLALELDLQLGYFLDERSRWMVLAMVGLMTIAFPLTSALLLVRAGLITSLEMPTRRERIAPFAMTVLYYGMTWYLLSRSPLHPLMLALFGGAVAALLLTTLITLRWKVSAHMVGIGGCLGALVALNTQHGLGAFIPVCIVLILAGALGTARLLTSDHTSAQVYAGAALGFTSVFAAVMWMPRLPF
ncbi:MAG: hypothetical protein IPM46_02885 [Flavobacteriales bacterium]|nr:hypothetical protein [Flavobacteriales bacterium]